MTQAGLVALDDCGVVGGADRTADAKPFEEVDGDGGATFTCGTVIASDIMNGSQQRRQTVAVRYHESRCNIAVSDCQCCRDKFLELVFEDKR